MKLYYLLKILICFLGIGLSFNTYANTPQPNPPFIFSYPSSINIDINNYAASIQNLNSLKSGAVIKGMITKVWQIDPSTSSPTSKPCIDKPFYANCIDATKYPKLALNTNNLAVINAVNSKAINDYPIAQSLATKMINSLSINK